MKPTFALDLSRDTIALLHRTSKGWLSVGEVGFDTPDLADALDYLRKTALGLSPLGMATKIVLPASQILYAEIHAPGTSRKDKQRQIAAALEGRTPYAVADLVFDWTGKGPNVQVAVVARETLDEAEAFAVGHRFNPVSFVAIPEAGQFTGEAWFGPTTAAAGILPASEKVERDSEPVVILQRDFPKADPVADPIPKPEPAPAPEAEPAPTPEAEPEPKADPAPAPAVGTDADPVEDLPGLEAALNADLAPFATVAAEGVGSGFGSESAVLAGGDGASVSGTDDAAPFTPELEDEVDGLPGGAGPGLIPPEDAPQSAISAPTMPPSSGLPPKEAPFAEVLAEDGPKGEGQVGDPSSEATAALTALPDTPGRTPVAVSALETAAPDLVDTVNTTKAAEIGALQAGADSSGSPQTAAKNDLATEALVDEAPFTHVPDTANPPEHEAEPSPAAAAAAVRPVLADGLQDDLPPPPLAAAMMAFASRRAAAAALGAEPGTAFGGSAGGPLLARGVSGPGPRPTDRPGSATLPTAALADHPVRSAPPPTLPRPAPVNKAMGAAMGTGRTPQAQGAAGLVTAPSIPGTRAKPKGKLPTAEAAARSRLGAQGLRSPASPGGTFGAPKAKRKRAGLVFLVLVGLLLVSLALVAAWSSYLLVRDDPEVTTDVAPDSLPGVEDEMLADMQDPEGMTAPLPEAVAVSQGGQDTPEGTPVDVGALATESSDPTNPDLTSLESDPAAINLAEVEANDLPAGSLSDVVVPDGGTPGTDPASLGDPSPDTTIATDLTAGTPPIEDQDEIFLAAMDAPPPALDALALRAPAATLDEAPEPQMPPPAFGTVYQFDANGLLLPTADGILSPDGVMLVAGKPPLLPPLRSDAVTAAAAAAAALIPPATAPLPSSAQDASLVTGGGAGDELSVTAPDTATGAITGPVTDTEGAAEAARPVDPALEAARPRPRPEGLAPATEDDARLATDADVTVLAGLRPLPRPASVLVTASASRPADAPNADAPDAGLATADLGAQGASLAAQAEADRAAAVALEATNPSIVAISMRPAPRPRDFTNAVEAAVAAAARTPEPEVEIETAAAPTEQPTGNLKPEELDEVNEPEVANAAPSIPTKASVAKQATFANAINLSKLNLIGTFGTSSDRYALIRQSNGRYKNVEVGDKIDGGRVQAITETEVRYEKNGRLVSLKMPKS